MIALLIISHSATLAEGVQQLAQQMAPDVPILVAGGTDEDEIGTSFERIYSQVQSGLQHDGVLVLMDLGSAVMTAETALEMLEPEDHARVRLSNAPLVEGALAAATTAAGGGPLDEVAAAAEGARSMRKVEGGEGEAAATEERPVTARRVMVLPNPMGLHARPAAQIVRALAPFEATVRMRNLTRQSARVPGNSLVALLGLTARQGDELEISAGGADAQRALDRLVELVEAGFGEMEAAPPVLEPAPPPPIEAKGDGDVQGHAAAPGIGIGPLWRLEPALLQPTPTPSGPPEEEQRHLSDALRVAKEALITLSRTTSSEGEIFAAHALLLEDPTLQQTARKRIDAGESAAHAWWAVTQEEAERLQQSKNQLIAERAADLQDVGQRVLQELSGEAALGAIPPGVVAVAESFVPSLVAALAEAGVAALVGARGGPTSHVAILARGLGLPTVLGTGDAFGTVVNGTLLIVDGSSGRIIVAPDEERRATYEREAAEAKAQLEVSRVAAHAPAVTQSGRRIIVAANVASVAEAEAAVANGADGVGLLRTEFLFLDRDSLPDEESQVAALRAILAPLGERSIVVRTLDVGGDKSVPALGLTMERNGFLGERGLRYCLNHPDLFRTQLRAILRAATGHRVSLMFPMVTTVDEVRTARHLLGEVQADLDREGVAWAAPEEIGIMVEVPAAALAAHTVVAEVDFFSVGSNDLIQYTMAAERTNEAVASLYQPGHPAFWALLEQLVRQAHAGNCWVGLCGEVGGDPEMTARLVHAGLDELSMAPAAIPLVKAAVRQVDG